MSLSPAERTLRARIAAHTSWANTSDPVGRTEAARKTFRDSFDAHVAPEITDPDERARCADHLRRAHYARLAYKSAQARRAKAGPTTKSQT